MKVSIESSIDIEIYKNEKEILKSVEELFINEDVSYCINVFYRKIKKNKIDNSIIIQITFFFWSW